MAAKKIRKLAELAVKLGITTLCLYLVYRKIDLAQLKTVLDQTIWPYLLLAALFFILSKVISAVRLNHFFDATGLALKATDNMKLYWLGMFYNLFLPGGIGGDGYKVYVLNKYFKVPVKKLVAAVFTDRVSGVLALGLAACILAAFAPIPIPLYLRIGLMLAVPLVYLAYRLALRRWMPAFSPIAFKTNIQAMYVQLAQLVSVIAILWALRIQEHYLDYLVIFLVSSVVAVLPLTVGGVGAREIVFLYGAQVLGLDMQASVAISLVFFLITAVVSLWGAVYSFGFTKVFAGYPGIPEISLSEKR